MTVHVVTGSKVIRKEGDDEEDREQRSGDMRSGVRIRSVNVGLTLSV